MFNYTEYKFIGHDNETILDIKKRIATKLNLIY